MRIALISNTHELHRELAVPAGHMLVLAGDFTFYSQVPPGAYRHSDIWLGGVGCATALLLNQGLPERKDVTGSGAAGAKPPGEYGSGVRRL